MKSNIPLKLAKSGPPSPSASFSISLQRHFIPIVPKIGEDDCLKNLGDNGDFVDLAEFRREGAGGGRCCVSIERDLWLIDTFKEGTRVISDPTLPRGVLSSNLLVEVLDPVSDSSCPRYTALGRAGNIGVASETGAITPADRVGEGSFSSREDRPRPLKLGKESRSHGGMSEGGEGSEQKVNEAGRGERYSAVRSGRRRKWIRGR